MWALGQGAELAVLRPTHPVVLLQLLFVDPEHSASFSWLFSPLFGSTFY